MFEVLGKTQAYGTAVEGFVSKGSIVKLCKMSCLLE